MRTLNHKVITQTSEWAFILSKLEDIERAFVDDILLAASDGNTARVQFLSGQVQQIRVFKTMPQDWMPEIKE